MLPLPAHRVGFLKIAVFGRGIGCLSLFPPAAKDEAKGEIQVIVCALNVPFVVGCQAQAVKEFHTGTGHDAQPCIDVIINVAGVHAHAAANKIGDFFSSPPVVIYDGEHISCIFN